MKRCKIGFAYDVGIGRGLGHQSRAYAFCKIFPETILFPLDWTIIAGELHSESFQFVVTSVESRVLDCLVVDSYVLSKWAIDELVVASRDTIVIFIDDYNRIHYPDSIVVHPGPSFKYIDYSSQATNVFGGWEFALLDTCHVRRQPSRYESQIVVNLGDYNFSRDVVTLFRKISNRIKCSTIIFCNTKSFNSIESESNVTVAQFIDKKKYLSILKNSLFAVVGSGQSSLESYLISSSFMVAKVSADQEFLYRFWRDEIGEKYCCDTDNIDFLETLTHKVEEGCDTQRTEASERNKEMDKKMENIRRSIGTGYRQLLGLL